MKITLPKIVLTNLLIIIVFMSVTSSVCPEGLIGGECVKHLDNTVFIVQVIANIVFSAYYLTQIDHRKAGVVALNFLLLLLIYFVAAALHSISKAGLF